jgi:hypothetical protein
VTLHAALQWIKQQVIAKRQHGVHSPFLYDFATQVVACRATFPIPNALQEVTGMPADYLQLIGAITHYYHYSTIIIGDIVNAGKPEPSALYILPNTSPERWESYRRAIAQGRGAEYLIVLPQIHATQAHSQAWERLCIADDICMYIDMYYLGFIWYRPEFMHAQQFRLKP